MGLKTYIRCRKPIDVIQLFSKRSVNKVFLFVLKMNVLKKLEDLKPNKLYHGFAKLSIGYHEIRCFRSVRNKFGKKGGSGKSIIVELEDQILFLPQYFWQKLNENDLQELNSSIENGEYVYLYFGGKQEEGM